jgi:glycerol-1-phosphate dehydrogenase [NAD(P)+]
MFPDKRPIVVADVTTFEIAGRELQNRFVEAGLNPDKPFIFDEPHFHAEWKFVEMLDAVLKKTDAIPVAVGSGTINDLNKLSSYHNNRRYMTVATAASMDGYTAFGASITKDGAKQTFSCPAPLAVLADTAIISKAPAKMTASGYADLFAKVPAGADWILADALGVEPLDEFSFGVVQGGLKNALGNPEALCHGDKTAMHNLIEGLILGGFAMQAHKSSRPASGADHQFSHLWNMEHHEMADGTVPSHGFQVSIGMLMSSALYSCMLDDDFSKLDVDACVAAWPSLEDAKAEALKMFEGTDFPTIGATEVEAKYVDKDGLRKQLTTLRDNWHEISAKLKAQIIPVEQAKRMLAAVGAPTEPEQIGISKERLRNSAIRAEKIRRRFTILDVAVRTGKLNDWLDKIFSHPKRNLHSGFAKVSSAESCSRQSIHH